MRYDAIAVADREIPAWQWTRIWLVGVVDRAVCMNLQISGQGKDMLIIMYVTSRGWEGDRMRGLATGR